MPRVAFADVIGWVTPDIVHYRGGSKPWALDAFAALNGLPPRANDAANDEANGGATKSKKPKKPKQKATPIAATATHATATTATTAAHGSAAAELVVVAQPRVRWLDAQADTDAWRRADRCGQFMASLQQLIVRTPE